MINEDHMPASKKAAPPKKTTTTVAFRISPELAEQIKDAATVTNQTQTDFVVAAITGRIAPLKTKIYKLKQLRSK